MMDIILFAIFAVFLLYHDWTMEKAEPARQPVKLAAMIVWAFLALLATARVHEEILETKLEKIEQILMEDYGYETDD